MKPKKNRLTLVNATQEWSNKTPRNWRVYLHSSNGSVWTIGAALSEKRARELAVELGHFSGLRATCMGKTVKDA